MQITAVEVKARRRTMSLKEREAALAQASNFSRFIKEIQTKADSVELWGIAWRNLLATMLDYGFRVYGQLDQFMQHNEWAEQHSLVLKSIANGDLAIDVESRGRLLVIDSSGSASTQDTDGDKFHETICLSRAEAFSVLTRSDTNFTDSVNRNIGDWALQPNRDEGFTKSPVVDEQTSDPILKNVADIEPPIYSAPTAEAVIDLNEDLVNTASENEGEGEAQDNDSGQVIDLEESGIKFNVGRTINQFTEEELHFFPGNTALTQLNVGIVGDLGTGKTQLIQALVQQLGADPDMNRGKRPNILIFDYKRDYSKPDFVKATGARVISPFDIPLNLFDIRDSGSEKRAILERS